MSELRTLMLKSGDKADIASLRISAITRYGGASLMFPRDESRVFADFRGVA